MSKKGVLKKIAVIGCLVSLSPYVMAASVAGSTQATPAFVYDDASFNEIVLQYKQLVDMYTSLESIDTSGAHIHGDLNGLFKINGQSVGELYNNIGSEADSWKWTADTWDEELRSLSGGNNARYTQLKNQYQTYYPNVVSQSTYQKGSTTQAAQAYAQATTVNQTALTEASYQFQDLNNRLNEIQDLSKQIGSALTEKEALDLNSKLAVQQAYIQVEMLRMQTLANQQIGQVQAESLEQQAAESNYYSGSLPTH